MAETPTFKHGDFKPIMSVIAITSLLIMCIYTICMVVTIISAIRNVAD